MNKYLALPLVLLCVAIILYITILSENAKERDLLQNHSITVGTIERVEIFKGVYYTYYTFKIDDKKYSESQRINVANTSLSYLANLLEEKTMRVIYQPNRISNNHLLLEKIDYEKFNIKADSSIYKILNALDSLKI